MKYVKLANVCLAFENIRSNGLFSIWHWKLDPYLMLENDGLEEIKVVEKEIPFCESKLLDEFDQGFFRRQIYLGDNGQTIWIFQRKKNNEVYLRYVVDETWQQITLVEDKTGTNGQYAFEYLGFIMPYVLLNYQILTFHGVLFEYEGKGVIISAPSGTGKTTHARMWRNHKNALIINGDKATCLKENNQWMGYGLPWSGTSGEQINRKVPIKAFVILERGLENKTKQLTPLEAFGEILSQVQCPAWNQTLVENCLELMDEFMRDIPIVRLACLPNENAVDVLLEALEKIWK